MADSEGNLAAMVGCSRENVNRCLRQMQKRGFVALREGWIVILQPDAPGISAELLTLLETSFRSSRAEPRFGVVAIARRL